MRIQPKSQLAAPDKKELILNAAIPVFGKSGFKKTSIKDLADAADISKQGLYLHFSSKEEILPCDIPAGSHSADSRQSCWEDVR